MYGEASQHAGSCHSRIMFQPELVWLGRNEPGNARFVPDGNA